MNLLHIQGDSDRRALCSTTNNYQEIYLNIFTIKGCIVADLGTFEGLNDTQNCEMYCTPF